MVETAIVRWSRSKSSTFPYCSVNCNLVQKIHQKLELQHWTFGIQEIKFDWHFDNSSKTPPNATKVQASAFMLRELQNSWLPFFCEKYKQLLFHEFTWREVCLQKLQVSCGEGVQKSFLTQRMYNLCVWTFLRKSESWKLAFKSHFCLCKKWISKGI